MRNSGNRIYDYAHSFFEEDIQLNARYRYNDIHGRRLERFVSSF